MKQINLCNYVTIWEKCQEGEGIRKCKSLVRFALISKMEESLFVLVRKRLSFQFILQEKEVSAEYSNYRNAYCHVRRSRYVLYLQSRIVSLRACVVQQKREL